MSVGKRVEETIAKMDASDPEGALFQISSAIDATAKKERNKGGRTSYKDFIHENLELITCVAFRGVTIQNIKLRYEHPDIKTNERGCCTVEEILYHAVRCGLYHAATLPSNLRFHGGRTFEVDGDALVLPSELVYGLIAAVVISPANANEKVSGCSILNLLNEPMLLNCLWGKRHEFLWMLEVRKATLAALRRSPKSL